MELLYYGHDADLQSIKKCFIHEEPCTFFTRNPDTAMCYKCKAEKENTLGKSKLQRASTTFANNSLSNSQSDLGSPSINHQAISRIIRVDDYTRTQVDQLKTKFQEMKQVYRENLDDIKLKNKCY